MATLAATSISSTQATLQGNVTSSGGDAPFITLYYGASDGADNAANWSNSVELGQLGAGPFSYPIGDLIPSTTYHYRVRATNSAALDGVWASSSQSFSTPASTNPVVANGAVINASGSQVTLLGKVISPGNGTINQGSANFTANRYDSLMLWLDANDSSTLDQGYASGETGVPNTNESVGYWADKSGKGYHAIANRKLSDRRPTYKTTTTGFQDMPTLGFNGINNAMTITGSEVAFDKWDEMSAFIVFEGVTLGNWDMILRKRTETGGWYFGSGNGLRAYFYVVGTSANDTQYSAHGANWNNAQIITLQFGKGTRKWYFNGEEKMTVNDLGTMASSSDAPLVIGAHLQASGNDTSEAPMNLSEVLIFRNRLALPDQRKIEGYLAHKWDLNSSLDASHPYRAAIPTFNDSIICG